MFKELAFFAIIVFLSAMLGGIFVSGFLNFKSFATPSDWAKRMDCGSLLVSIGFSPDEGFCTENGGTKSMSPLVGISQHALVFVKKDISQINIGDIVLFKDGEARIFHRVVGKGFDGNFFLETQGDNNLFGDGVKVREIEGVLVGVIY